MDKIAIIDFGGQYCHLIARRIREIGVYSEILPYNTSFENLDEVHPKGIILSGGPSSVYEPNSPKLERPTFQKIMENKIPILGICYGFHLIIHELGGTIESKKKKEYGKTLLEIKDFNIIFDGLEKKEIAWMSHGDQVLTLPEGFNILAATENCPIAAYENKEKNIYGVQFHPEVTNTPKGNKILENFVFKIAKCKKEWELGDWISREINDIKLIVGKKDNVILGLSGGVDSSVTALLLHEAIGDRLHCIFINNGLLRKNEEHEVIRTFKEELNFKNFHHVDAQEFFLKKLDNIVDPEEKRKIIGHAFIKIFEDKTIELEHEFPDIKYLAQGTIYPDRVETATTSTASAKIKSHHNLTLPEEMMLEIIEPLKELYKDEVRKIGLKLGLPKNIINRHPFPGPGLAVRCIGAVTKERLNILRDADDILIEEIKKAGLYDDLWQVFCVLLPVKSVGIMGDFRTYENLCAIRAVESRDAMTANFAKLDWNLLEKIGTRIINEVKGINRVVYDISNKPPSTIEYE